MSGTGSRRDVHASTNTTITPGQSPAPNIASSRWIDRRLERVTADPRVDLAGEPLDHEYARHRAMAQPGRPVDVQRTPAGSPSGLPARSSDCTTSWSSVPASSRGQGGPGRPSSSRSDMTGTVSGRSRHVSVPAARGTRPAPRVHGTPRSGDWAVGIVSRLTADLENRQGMTDRVQNPQRDGAGADLDAVETSE